MVIVALSVELTVPGRLAGVEDASTARQLAGALSVGKPPAGKEPVNFSFAPDEIYASVESGALENPFGINVAVAEYEKDWLATFKIASESFT